MTILPNGSDSGFIQKVLGTIQTHSLLRPGDAVLLGVSGGPDSVALLHILETLATRYNLKLGVAHLDHGLRGDQARREAGFVAEMAVDYGLRFHGGREDVRRFQRRRGLSLEEAARRVRYTFLETVAAENGYQCIATGHQADDNAELMLMNFLRGSGPQGMTGIPYRRPSSLRQIRIIRPLLDVTRTDIVHFLGAHNLAFVEDPSNLSLRHTRNRIRHQLLPLIKEKYNRNIVATLKRSAEVFTAEQDWANDLAQTHLQVCTASQMPGEIHLLLERLRKHPKALKRRIVRLALGAVKGNLKGLSLTHTDAVLALLVPGDRQTGKQTHLPGGLWALRSDTLLMVGRKPQSEVATADYQYLLAVPGKQSIPEAGVTLATSLMVPADLPDWRNTDASKAYMDADRVGPQLTVRNFRPGDRFKPLGLGGRQKVKTFFINNKISRQVRGRCPLVFSGQNIVWIAGHRIAEGVKITPQTRRVLKIQLLLA